MGQVPWTRAEKAIVKEGRLKGESAGMIVRKLRGRTRSAVIALAHREGYDTPVPERGGEVKPGALPKVRRQANRPVKVADPEPRPLPPPPAPPPPEAAATMRRVPLEQLERDECRFAVSGEQGRHLFCGAPGTPWCDHHRKAVYQPAREA